MKRVKGEVKPVFAPLDGEHRAQAERMIGLFQAHVGRRRGLLMDRVQDVEREAGLRFKFARGLATLLERRSHFEVSATVDPLKARRAAFEASARRGGAALTAEERQACLEEAGLKLGVGAGEIERAMTADLEENLLLVAVDAPSPDELLRAYNVALAQTLLFDAAEVEFTLRSGYREFLGMVKLHGLMYELEALSRGYRVKVDGPVSLFKDTRRYGTAIAKLLPVLARCGEWGLRARILEKFDGASRERVFETHQEELPATRERGGDAFDSRPESRLASAFSGLKGPWRLVREPAPVRCGRDLFLPDFGFAWDPAGEGVGEPSAFLEIMGYWTPGYLKRKLEKLRSLPEGTDLLVAVNRDLGVGEEAFEGAPVHVIFFRGDDVPLVPVVRWLEARGSRHAEREAGRLLEALPQAEGPVISARALARERGVSLEAAERALDGMDLSGWVRVGGQWLTPGTLKRAETALEEGLPLPEAESRLRALGIEEASSVFRHLGYQAAWRGLDPESAVLTRLAPAAFSP